MKKYIISISILIIFALLSSCKGHHSRDYSPQTNFEQLWDILDKKYCFFSEKNIDWNEVKEIYQPKVSDVNSQLAMFDLFAKMLDTLQDGHVNLYSEFDVSVCRGWFEDYPANFNESLIFSSRYLGKNYRIGGSFLYNLVDNGNIGYIRYDSFSKPVSIASLLFIGEIFKSCRGIIIDVRNNGGGALEYSKSFASIFMNSDTHTGYIRHKTGYGHDDFSSVEAVYTPKNKYVDWSNKRIVVLVNRRCYSATNDFICRIKNAPNVIVLGGITGGGGGIPLSNELPNGWLIRFSSVQILDKDMNQIEFGVEPDIEVNLLDEDVDNGFDTLIETAINKINS